MIKPDVVLYEESLDEMVVKAKYFANTTGRFANCRGYFFVGFILQLALYNIFVENIWS